MASPSDFKKIVETEVAEVELEKKHVERHGLLAILLIAALLVVAYSMQASHAPIQSYHLDGNYIDLRWDGMAVYPGQDSFSAEAWIKTSDSGDGIIVSSGECCGAESYWSMGKTSTGSAAVLFVRLNDGSGEISGSGRKNIADGNWHHVLFVRDRGAKKVFGYVDGEPEAEFPDTTGEISDKSTQLMAGNSNPYQSEWFRGYISEVKTYPLALSPGEVREKYDGSLINFQVSQ